MVAFACLAVALALRVMGRTRSMLGITVVMLAMNPGLLAALLPRHGVEAATVALLGSTACGTLYLLWQATGALRLPVTSFVPLGALNLPEARDLWQGGIGHIAMRGRGAS